MNPWSEPLGLALIVVAVAAVLSVPLSKNEVQRRRRFAIATAVLAVEAFALVALFAVSFIFCCGEEIL